MERVSQVSILLRHLLVTKNQSQLKKNILSGSSTAAGGIIISIIAYPIYLHFLGAASYGLWAILAVIIYFCSIGNFGIDEALIKFIAQEFAQGKRDNVVSYISTGLNALLVNGVLIFIILMLFQKTLRTILNLDAEYTVLFQNIFPYIIALSIFILIVQFINAILKGLGRYDQASYIQLIGRACALIVSILFFIKGYKIWGLFWGQFLSFVFVLIVSSFYICKKIHFYYRPLRIHRTFLLNLFRFGGTITVSKILSMLLEPFIKVVIARYVGLAEVTYFEIAHKIVYQIRSLFERGISAIMPEVSRLSADVVNAKSRISNVMKRVNKMNFLIGTSVFVLLFILCEPLLKLWLSDDYNKTIILAFRIIILGYTVNLISVPMYYYFMGVGSVRYCFYNHSIQAVLNFVLVMVLISAGFINFNTVSIVYSLSIALSAGILIFLYYRNISVTV